MPTDERADDLQRFIDSVRFAISGGGKLSEPADATARNIFAALGESVGKNGHGDPGHLPVCAHLPDAYANARQGPQAAIQLAEAFAAIEPNLKWRRKPTDDAAFAERHANAVIIGADGVEQRDDVRIGVSLLAPGTRYPDHNHPPEEIYAVLSPGAWRQNDGPWREPGLGGLVYNPSNITHAMRSYDAPLLAVWSLWLGG